MARSSPVQTSFNTGVVSPRLWGRADIAKYASGCEVCENFVAMVQGPALRRSGFRYVADTESFADPVCLLPFEVSDEEAYTLSLAPLRMRFFTQEAALLSGGVPLEVVTPYLANELFEIQIAQSADTLFLVQKGHPPQALRRTSPTMFVLEEATFFDGPWDRPNITDTEMSYATGIQGDPLTVTASAAVFLAGRDEGRLLRLTAAVITDTTSWGYTRIVSVTSPTVVQTVVVRDVPISTGTRNWRLGAWYPGNYPRAVTFDDQRLVFAADPANPQVAYLSVTDDFTNFTPTGDSNRAAPAAAVTNEVFETSGFRLELSANQVNTIGWLASLKVLLEGTSGGLWQIQSSSNVEPLTPVNAHARRASDRGGAPVAPAIVDDAVVFVSPTTRKVFRGAFSLNRESYSVEDLTLLADHLTSRGVRQLAWALEPMSVLWCVTNEGRLLGLTLDSQQEIAAWHTHPVGGTDARVESVCVITAPAGTPSGGAHENQKHDQLWVVVARTVNGVERRSVEFLEDFFPDEQTLEHAFFVDGGFSYVGVPVTEISGLDHLEGESVQVLADGSYVGDHVVSAGAITLAVPASRVHAGLGYLSRVRPLRLEAGDAQGSSQGKTKRVDHVTLRLHRTVGGRVRADLRTEDMEELVYDDHDALLGEEPNFFTGDTTVAVDAPWSTHGQVEIQQPAPLPMTVTALIYRVESSPRGS